MLQLKGRGYSLGIALFLLLIATESQAQDYSILNAFETEDNVFAVRILHDTTVDLILEQKPAGRDTVSILLSPFENQNKRVKRFRLKDPAGNSYTDSTFWIENQFHKLTLATGKLELGEEYRGYVIIQRMNKEIKRFLISIERVSKAKPAVIKLGRSNRNISTTARMGEFSFRIYEESGEQPLIFPYLRIIENSSTENHHDLHDFDFKIEGYPDVHIWNADSNEKISTLPEGKNFIINSTVKNLRSGSQTLKFEIGAQNSDPSKNPTLTVNIKRKDPWYYALAVIVIAIVFTVVTKKLVSIWKEQIVLRNRANKINQGFSNLIPYNAATIRVKMILNMVTTASKRSLSDFGKFNDDLTLAEEISEYLRRTSEIFYEIERMPKGMKERRAKKKYSGILKDLAVLQLNESNKLEIEKKIISLESWFSDPSTFDELYAKDLAKDIKNLIGVFDRNQFASSYDKIDTLLTAAGNESGKIIDRENAYSVLKIFWEKRKDDIFPEIYEAYLNGDVEDVFLKADDLNWQRLVQANENGHVVLELPRGKSEGTETFQSMQFKIAPLDTKVGDNYLFKHGLTYKWIVNIEGERVNKTLEATTNQPKITQFSPITGKVSAHVSVMYGDQHFELLSDPASTLTVVQSSSTRIIRMANRKEWITMGAAVVVAVLTGLSSYYYGEDFVGTAKDYILLFLWGAGIEQGTSFLAYLNQDPG